MELKNMKLPGGDYDGPISPSSSSAPEYPYGLRLHLSDKVLERLGLKTLPNAGQTLVLHARVSVDSVSQRETGTEKSRELGLQITDLALAPDIDLGAAADKLYGS